MKKTLLLAAMCGWMLGSCQQVTIDENGQETEITEQVKKFIFHVKGDFLTSFEDMTRAAVRLEEKNEAGVTDLWVLDYVDGTLVQSVHQASGDESFGAVAMNLTYGHHDVKFVASKGTEPVLTATALTWGKVKDTFVLDYPVDVVASSNGNRAPELKRAVAGLKLVMTDEIPQDAKWLCITLGKRSQTLVLPSLSALPYEESAAEIDCSGNRGVNGANATVYTLAGDEEWKSTASIVVKREDGTVITTVALPDVMLKKNRITTLTGEVFGRGSGFSVSIDDSWESPLEMEF